MLRGIAKNIAVKVPLTPDGLKACRHLAGDGAMVNVTLCFSRGAGDCWRPRPAPPSSARSSAGSTTWASDGMGLIADIVTIYRNYETFKTEVLVASVRNPTHVVEAAKIGAACRHRAAGDPAPAVQPSADRQGPRRLPCRLGQDRPADRLNGRA